jgi:hypothetical protein
MREKPVHTFKHTTRIYRMSLNSFFFVSTDTTGWPRFCKRRTCVLMYSNWALRRDACLLRASCD